MKIWSNLRPYVIWVEPSRYGPADSFGRRTQTPGLKIEFTTLGGPGAGSVFDTEAQGWDDERREEIEAYLRGHRDWGFQLFQADETVTTGRSAAGCEVMTIVHGGVRKCGRPVSEVGEVCDIHQGVAQAEDEQLDDERTDQDLIDDEDLIDEAVG